MPEYCTCTLSFKVTPAEEDTLRHAARMKGIPLSGFLRGLVTSKALLGCRKEETRGVKL